MALYKFCIIIIIITAATTVVCSAAGLISRENAWECRSHCWKAAGTHGNGISIVITGGRQSALC